GRCHPARSATRRSQHVLTASSHILWLVCGVRSHTNPVSLSRTAWLLKSGRTVKRLSLGSFVSQFWLVVEVAESPGLLGGAAPALSVMTLSTTTPTSVTILPPTHTSLIMMISCVWTEGVF